MSVECSTTSNNSKQYSKDFQSIPKYSKAQPALTCSSTPEQHSKHQRLPRFPKRNCQAKSFLNNEGGKKNIYQYMRSEMPCHFKTVSGHDLVDDYDMVAIPCGVEVQRVRYEELCLRAPMWFSDVSALKNNPPLG